MQSSLEELGNARINLLARSFYLMCLPSLPAEMIAEWLLAETCPRIQERLFRELVANEAVGSA